MILRGLEPLPESVRAGRSVEDASDDRAVSWVELPLADSAVSAGETPKSQNCEHAGCGVPECGVNDGGLLVGPLHLADVKSTLESLPSGPVVMLSVHAEPLLALRVALGAPRVDLAVVGWGYRHGCTFLRLEPVTSPKPDHAISCVDDLIIDALCALPEYEHAMANAEILEHLRRAACSEGSGVTITDDGFLLFEGNAEELRVQLASLQERYDRLANSRAVNFARKCWRVSRVFRKVVRR